MFQHLNKVGFFILLLITNNCFALDTDRQQIASLKADSADINRKSGINNYRGHVEFIQGTTQIQSDVGMTKTDEKNQLLEAIAKSESETLAHYQTQPKPN